MNRLALAFAATLAAGAAGLATAPAHAEHFGGGMVRVQSPHWDNGPRNPYGGYRGQWDGPDRRWNGGGWSGHGWRGGWGPRCRTVMTTRYSYRWGGYVQRPVEVCD